MTNEDAIHFLMNIGHYVEYIDGHICVRAPLMDASLLAIKALRSQHHGKWLKNWCDTGMIGHEYAECSLCGCQMIDTNVFWDSKFCPRCGAQMIKEN